MERCHISISFPLTDRLTIQFLCRHGSVSWTKDRAAEKSTFMNSQLILNLHKKKKQIVLSSSSWCIADCQHLVAACSQLPRCSFCLSLLPGITKTHNLRFQDSAALQAVFCSHLCPNMLKAPARSAASRKFFMTGKNCDQVLRIFPRGPQNLLAL